MKSVRLNEAKRKDILNSVMEAWKQNNEEPLLKKQKDYVAEYYYDLAYNKAMQNLLNDSRLQAFMRKGTDFKVQVNGIMYLARLNEEKVLPLKDGYDCVCILSVNEKPACHKVLEELEIEQSKWEKERTTMRNETRELLEPCTTTTQILEMWPQIEPLLPAYLADPERGVNLPSIPVSRLNERLGIGIKTTDDGGK